MSGNVAVPFVHSRKRQFAFASSSLRLDGKEKKENDRWIRERRERSLFFRSLGFDKPVFDERGLGWCGGEVGGVDY
ncbi:Hypothetical predicted protein [Olea europaea subsp. europaea]|uniref:Uncharacterized protein n=1 Tax=Olea europaea subsp. europaea TaxID=158383 RepID=A0A8S0TDQ6_OLEEU|nr:Hypothetical predicted protein [Olea europaea subsp. europaea]